MTAVLSFVLLAVLAVGMIVYIILVYESYKNKDWLFAPFNSPPPSNSCYPLGAVIKLSPDQIAKRAELLQNAPPKGTPVYCDTTPSSDIL